MTSIRRLLLPAAFSLLCSASFAQAPFQDFYIEGIVGQTSFDLNTTPFTSNAFTNTTPAPAGTAPNSITITNTKTSDTAFGLRLGYEILPWMPVELTWIDTGTARVRGVGVLNTPAASASAVSFSTGLHVQVWSLAAAPRFDFGERFTIMGRVGLSVLTAKWGKSISAAVTPASAQSAARILQDAFRSNEQATEIYYGAGLAYRFNDRFSAGINYDLYDGPQEAKVVSGSLRYSF